jgi:hypothetical protein
MTTSTQPRYTLDELKKKARGAFNNQKLVDLASKDLSPTTVMEIAESSREYGEWLCRAARFLAIIKRDYGVETFNRVIQEERVAQEERMRNRRESDEVLQEIDGIALDIQDIDTELDYLATLDLEILKEGFQRLPKDKNLHFYIRKLAGLQAKLRGLEAYAG